MTDCNKVVSPLEPGAFLDLSRRVQKVTTETKKKLVNAVSYREAIGQLLYLSTKARPDISLAVGILSRHVSNPQEDHWKAVKRLFRYLKGTRDLCIKIKPNSGLISAEADASWASTEDRKSISGQILLFGGVPITWGSRRQTVTAMSSCDSENVSLSEVSREIRWLRRLAIQLGYHQEEPTRVAQDNLGARSWTKGNGQLRRVKHIDIKYHFIREMVDNGEIYPVSTSTVNMIADTLTKPLSGEKHRRGLKQLKLERLE